MGEKGVKKEVKEVKEDKEATEPKEAKEPQAAPVKPKKEAYVPQPHDEMIAHYKGFHVKWTGLFWLFPDIRIPKFKPDHPMAWAPPFDPRFPCQNQTRNCYQNYIDYHRCHSKYGDDHAPCEYFKKVYTHLCPKSWYDKWDEGRENGTFPGRISKETGWDYERLSPKLN